MKDEDIQNATMIDAIRIAQKAEMSAAEFYKKAAEGTSDPKGKNMFDQLVAFEKSHFAALSKLLESLDQGNFEGYEGYSFTKNSTEASTFEKLDEIQLKTTIDALNFAIEAEKKAKEAYTDLAVKSTNEILANLFNKLATEEGLHRKVLEDQFLALTNQGYWTWGE